MQAGTAAYLCMAIPAAQAQAQGHINKGNGSMCASSLEICAFHAAVSAAQIQRQNVFWTVNFLRYAPIAVMTPLMRTLLRFFRSSFTSFCVCLLAPSGIFCSVAVMAASAADGSGMKYTTTPKKSTPK